MMTEQDRHRLDRILSSLEGLVATVQDIVSRLDVKEFATPKSPSTTSTQPLRQAPALSPQQQQQRRHNETRELQEENTLKQDNFSNEKNNGLPNSDDAKEESAVVISEALQNLAPSNEGNDGHTLQEDEQSIKVSTIGIPVDRIDYSNDDYEDSIRFSSEKQLDQILPEARPSAARIALSRYKVWRRKRGRYHVMS